MSIFRDTYLIHMLKAVENGVEIRVRMSSDDEGPPLLVDTADTGAVVVDEAPPVPVTIVTGYLGSGKSTLLQNVTNRNRGQKIAVVLNEFGQTSDIERSMAVRNRNADGVEVEEWVELDNGCMCCTAKDAGVAAIENLMKRTGRYDHIVIETSGVADPAPIANMFWLDRALMASVKLDGVVTVVDARTILRSLADEGELASVQIACADVVLINKAETVDAADLAQVSTKIAEINGAAPRIECSYGNLEDPAQILNINAYSGSSQSFANVHATPANHIHNHLSTVVLNLAPLSEKDLAAFEATLQSLLWTKEVAGHQIEIHRAKGKLQCEGNRTKILQGVREVYEITDVDFEPEGECKLVLIGQNLSDVQPEIEALFPLR